MKDQNCVQCGGLIAPLSKYTVAGKAPLCGTCYYELTVPTEPPKLTVPTGPSKAKSCSCSPTSMYQDCPVHASWCECGQEYPEMECPLHGAPQYAKFHWCALCLKWKPKPKTKYSGACTDCNSLTHKGINGMTHKGVKKDCPAQGCSQPPPKFAPMLGYKGFENPGWLCPVCASTQNFTLQHSPVAVEEFEDISALVTHVVSYGTCDTHGKVTLAKETMTKESLVKKDFAKGGVVPYMPLSFNPSTTYTASWSESNSNSLHDFVKMKAYIQYGGGVYEASKQYFTSSLEASYTAPAPPSDPSPHYYGSTVHQGARSECDINCCIAERRKQKG